MFGATIRSKSISKSEIDDKRDFITDTLLALVYVAAYKKHQA